MSNARRARSGPRRKVTYSLPAELVAAVERRAAASKEAGVAPATASAIVAEALGCYLTGKEREELERQFEEAARDPMFREDNAAVARDFARLDREASGSGSGRSRRARRAGRARRARRG